MCVGPYYTGKSSTIRTLFGEPFVKEYKSTDGIKTYGLDIFSWIKRDNNEYFCHMSEDEIKKLLGDIIPLVECDGYAKTSEANVITELQLGSERLDDTLQRIDRKRPGNYSTFSLWDFAGQRIYQISHQIFLVKKGLYIIVVDISKSLNDTIHYSEDLKSFTEDKVKDDVSLWVNSIYYHSIPEPDIMKSDTIVSGGSKFIIVCTKKDLVDDKQVVKQRMSEIKDHIRKCTPKPFREMYAGMFAITNKGGVEADEEVPKLKNKILELSTVFKDKQPCAQVRLELALRQMKKRALPISEVYSKGKELGLDEETVDKALRYYHSIREMIHFHEDDVLKNVVIIDPPWLIDLLRIVVTQMPNYRERFDLSAELELHCSKLVEQGLLYEEMVDIILVQENRMEDKDVLLRMYEKFNIICRHCTMDSGKAVYYMPCMLNEGTLDPLKSKYESVIPLYYHFGDNFLPDSVFHQLVVKCLNSWNDATLFQNAARINIPEFSMILDLWKEGCDIGMKVCHTGEHHHSLLRVKETIGNHLRQIIKSQYSRLSYKECIKCSCGQHDGTKTMKWSLDLDDGCVATTKTVCSKTHPIDMPTQWISNDQAIGETQFGLITESNEHSSEAAATDSISTQVSEIGEKQCGSPFKRFKLDSFQPAIGIVVADEYEYQSIKLMFDAPPVEYNGKTNPNDPNYYQVGLVGGKKAVVTQLPVGMGGEDSAAVTVTHLCNAFSAIQLIFMVGVAGGVPNYQYNEASARKTTEYTRPHVRKGDVIVSYPIKDGGPAFVHYDYGEIISVLATCNVRQNIQRKQHIGLHPKALNAAREFARNSNVLGEQIGATINKMDEVQKVGFQRPADEEDVLPEGHNHPAEPHLRHPGEPKVHFGIMASANSAMRNTEVRDYLAVAENVIGFEMENRGVATAARISSKGCMFVRGVCDYSDEHKNGRWNRYAALIAKIKFN
uniref:Uncharacterized protein LOC102809977 n=1 Tax=Saccoglossus kowalevskii TaxID=10224 RepID=A0ABM0MEC9_SACKO|nr:PREDICTED: uncharacterized protein LOC102809977 [Saccoglossus kowalevskii]